MTLTIKLNDGFPLLGARPAKELGEEMGKGARGDIYAQSSLFPRVNLQTRICAGVWGVEPQDAARHFAAMTFLGEVFQLRSVTGGKEQLTELAHGCLYNLLELALHKERAGMHTYEDAKFIDAANMSVRELTDHEFMQNHPCEYCPPEKGIDVARLLVTYPDGKQKYACDLCRYQKDPVLTKIARRRQL